MVVQSCTGRTPALTHATTVAFVSPLVTSEAFLRHRRTHRLCTKFASKKTPVLSSRPSADNNHSLTRKANGRACFILTDDQQQGTKATPPHSRAGGHCAEDNDHEVSFARRRMIDRGTSNAFVASVLGLGLGLGRRGPAVRAADSAVSRQLEEYCSSDGSFALEYPADFKAFSKPLKTHKMEVRQTNHVKPSAVIPYAKRYSNANLQKRRAYLVKLGTFSIRLLLHSSDVKACEARGGLCFLTSDTPVCCRENGRSGRYNS